MNKTIIIVAIITSAFITLLIWLLPGYVFQNGEYCMSGKPPMSWKNTTICFNPNK